MDTIIECVANFSEGCNPQVLDALKQIAGASLLDVHIDADHNRSVFTTAGPPQFIADTAFAMAQEAVRLIDLNKHSGEHPRMGAVDVIPFVPIKNISMEECAAIARQVAKRIWEELGLPVYLYEEAATASHRKNLADIRRGGFEGMVQKMQQEKWKPDFGENVPHPTAGVVAVGARKPLIAFNINLNTSDIDIAKKIAKAVRGSSGGLPYCKALGMFLADRNIAQVSMNLTDYEQTPIYQVFEAVQTEAAKYGVSISGSELVGLAPSKALMDCAEHFLRLEGFFASKHVLENRIEDANKSN